MINLRETLKNINIRGSVLLDEPMSLHTTFRVGGPADIFVTPADEDDLRAVLAWSRKTGLPVFPLGGGANILVSDRGIRGIVVDMSRFSGHRLLEQNEAETFSSARHGTRVFVVGAGLPISDAAALAVDLGYRGIEHFYSMPGSVGGALLMNARCYDSSVSDSLEYTLILDEESRLRKLPFQADDFGYKKSPYQNRNIIITEAAFRLTPGDPAALRKVMEDYRTDRERKGHFAAPSAGSVFKNNRAFGKPTGVIIDSLGLRGLSSGGAKVSDVHANIIVNTGNAKAEDILNLIRIIEQKVQEAYGFRIEREVILAGDWRQE